MKIRVGFVSNSSSSSFLMVGLLVSDEDLNKIAKYISQTTDQKFTKDRDTYDYLQEHGYLIQYDEGTDQIYFGFSWDCSDEDGISEIPIAKLREKLTNVQNLADSAETGLEAALYFGIIYG